MQIVSPNKYFNYVDFISVIYGDTSSDECKETEHTNLHSSCRSITIQVTEDCNCACTYCYQGCKTTKAMTTEEGKNIVDLLFNEWYSHPTNEGFINQVDTKAIILDFIGGEPLLNMPVAEYICTYFATRCLKENHPWADTWLASFSTNGTLYFAEDVQKFIKKFHQHCCINITIDGPKELHDACRLYKNSDKGCFDEAYKALIYHRNHYDNHPGTKVTIAPENLQYIDKIASFFIENGIEIIHANPIYEHDWTIEEGKLFYQKLKQISDTILYTQPDKKVYFSILSEIYYSPMSEDGEDNRNWCGGTGAMMAIDPEGTIYPCLRYMKTSLGESVPPIVIGDTKNGLFMTEDQIKTKTFLDSITRRSQCTDECFYCPVARGCAWCSAWNYQEHGTPNKKTMHICNMQKAASLANVYFWNKYYIRENEKKFFERHLSDEDSLQFLTKEELQELDDIVSSAKRMCDEES